MLLSPPVLRDLLLNSLSLVMRGSEPGLATQNDILKVLNKEERNSVLVHCIKQILNSDRKGTVFRALVPPRALS